MRIDSAQFTARNEAASRQPRFVIKIGYTSSSPHFTSRESIANVPATAVQGVVRNVSGVTQSLAPEEARATIGTLSFDLVDVDGVVTTELRTQLATNDEGPRLRDVTVWMGFTDDFNDNEWRVLQTMVLDQIVQGDGVYRITCADRTRELRQNIFDRKQTNLDTAISDTATTIPAVDTTDFVLLAHTASFTDAPSSTVGYIKIDKEIIRYTGKTATTFTGCTRGVFGTEAKAVTISAGLADDRKPKIDEFIYLEMPGPQMAYAILTGVILGTSPADTLPDHWHLGIAESFIELSDYENIGEDLYDSTDVTAGAVLRFTHLKREDGKRFLEKQIYRLLGLFAPYYSTGEIGLKRGTRILIDGAFDEQLDSTNIIKRSQVTVDQRSVLNQFSVKWNWNGDEFTRENVFIDTNSIARHKESPLEELEFKGLHGARHTVVTLINIVDGLRDRFAAPPLRMRVQVLGSMNKIEVGDVVRVLDPTIRDYTDTTTLDRSFEVIQAQPNYVTGNISLSLFASSEDAAQTAPTTADPALANSFYNQIGTDLDSLGQVTGGAITSNLTLTGTADMNAAASIWYHVGNLTLNTGVTLTLNGNVQLRIQGFFTVNGDIDGLGNGKNGTADSSTIGVNVVETPAPVGFLGKTNSGNGVAHDFVTAVNQLGYVHWRGTLVRAQSSFPKLFLDVVSAGSPLVEDIKGIPTDFRGGGGSHGGPIVDAVPSTETAEILGATGGDGGAGLYVVCRGFGTGVSADIDLSGSNGSTPGSSTFRTISWFPGSGAGGGPGAFLILLDGEALAVPDLTGKFTSKNGISLQQGTNASFSGQQLKWNGPEPFSGILHTLSGKENANSALRIQYVPQETASGEDVEPLQNAPDNLAVASQPLGNLLAWANPASFDLIQIHASVDNVRGNAVQVGETKANTFFHLLDPGLRRYYWIRAVDEDGNLSDWENGGASPVTTTSGFATSGAEGVINDPYFSAPLDEEWESYILDPDASPPVTNGGVSIVGGLGELGANACRVIVSDTGSDTHGMTSLRKFAVTNGEVFQIRARLLLTTSVTSMLFGIRVFDQLGNHIIDKNGSVNVWDFITEGPGLGVWADVEVLVTIDIAPLSPPQLGADATLMGQAIFTTFNSGTSSPDSEVQFDSFTVVRSPQIFQGSNRLSGLVPAPISSTGRFLQDDGTWSTPGGGGEVNLGANVGSGADVFRNKTGVTLNLRGINPINGMTAVVNVDNVDIGTNPKNSVEIDAAQLQLVGDAAAPGASQYYGTDGSSPPVKGFHAVPTGIADGTLVDASARWSGAAWIESEALQIAPTNTPQAIELKGGTADQVFLAWFADSALQATVSARMGFTSAASDVLTITNDQGTTVNIPNDVLATSYGGVIQGNLLDKIADELITGAYRFKNDAGIVIEHGATTDSMNIFHNGTDVLATFVATNALRLQINQVHINDEAGGNQALVIGEDTTVRAAAQDGILALWGEQASTLREYRITNFGDIVRHAVATGLGVEWQGDGAWLFDLRDGATLTIRDAVDADSISFAHDGADATFVAVNATWDKFTGMSSGIWVDVEANATSMLRLGAPSTTRGNAQVSQLQMYGEDTSTIRVGSMVNTGLLLQFITGTLGVEWTSGSAWEFDVRDGGVLRIRDSTDADSGRIRHDGANFLVGPDTAGDGETILTRDANQAAIQTADRTANDIGTGGQVLDGLGTLRPIGFNVAPIFEQDANDAFDLAHNGMLWHKDALGAITYTCDNDAAIPQGATFLVANEDTESLTIAQGTGVTLRWFDGGGAALPTGNRSLAQGGACTVYKYTDTVFFVWGIGLT